MPNDGRLYLAVLLDPPQASDELLARLSPTERREGERRAGTARHQFVLGRLAAHTVIRRVMGEREGWRDAPAEVVNGSAGEPSVQGDAMPHPVSVSISHVNRGAAACAWPSTPDYAAGVDLERVRPTRIAQSAYAFSAYERDLLARVPQGADLAGLAGWTVKEAVWKALWPHQPPSPAAVRLRALSLDPPQVAAHVEDRTLTRDARCRIRVDMRMIVDADEAYVLAVAEVGGADLDLARLTTVGPRAVETK